MKAYLAQLQQRYERWRFDQLVRRLYDDGRYVPGLWLWGWLDEQLEILAPQFPEPTIDERYGHRITSVYQRLDDYMIDLIKATRLINEDAYAFNPRSEENEVSMETYLTDGYGRPQSLNAAIAQYIKVAAEYRKTLLAVPDPVKYSYYQRRFDWLAQEGQQWTDWLLHHL